MAAHQVTFDEFFAAPRERVFAFFADHGKFGRIFGGRFQRIRDSADPQDPNGLGSVRLIPGPGPSFEETIVTYQPPALIEYTITRGSPIRNHLGRIEFSDAPGGTRLHYTISFAPKIPLTGGLIAAILRSTWKRGVHRVMEDIGS